MQKGLFICGFLGGTPDGLARTGGESYLIEVKCPYKYRFQTMEDACKDKLFCCFLTMTTMFSSGDRTNISRTSWGK